MEVHVADGISTIRIDKIPKEDTLELRRSVLWPNSPISQVCLPEDESGIHYGAFQPHQGSPIAVISLFMEDLPIDNDGCAPDTKSEGQASRNIDGRTVRFRKFACDPECQGKGVGTQLLLHALSMARSDLGVTVAWCDARTATQEWYRKRGFDPFGSKFYKGPVEYIRMRIDLRDLESRNAVRLE